MAGAATLSIEPPSEAIIWPSSNTVKANRGVRPVVAGVGASVACGLMLLMSVPFEGLVKQSRDWLADVDLAVELVNTIYALADPPDRLISVTVFQAILGTTGAVEVAGDLYPKDLDRLRALRKRLAPIFAIDRITEVAARLNPMLQEGLAIPQLVEGRDGVWTVRADGGQRGIQAIEARLPAALAAFVATYGQHRLGVCHAPPCSCVYVDRTRAATRRYCCDQCNDRASAAAHRRRAGRAVRHKV